MSCVLPEIVIQAAIIGGMRYLRQNPDRLGQLFRDFPKKKREDIVAWLNSKKIRVVMGFPPQSATLPLWSIRVVGDEETQAFLGESLGDNILPQYEPVQYNERDSDGALYFNDEPALLGGGVTWQSDSDLQGEEIVGYTPDPDDDQREIGDGGDPRWTRDTLVERHGAYYRADFQVQTLADNGEVVAVLSHIMRAILEKARIFMARNGIQNVIIGRRDLAPMVGYFPISAFVQATTLRFEYLFEEQDEGASVDSLEFVLETLNFPGDTPLAV